MFSANENKEKIKIRSKKRIMIYINSTLRIRRLDPHSLQLEEYRTAEDCHLTKNKGHKWRGCGYYGDLKSALLGALSKRLFDSAQNEMTIKEVIAKIDEARTEIIKAIENIEKKNPDP